MKQIKVNQSNKRYYSEDFIKGFECGTKTQFDADKEVIDRIKEAREEIIKASFPEDEEYSVAKIIYLGDALAVLDKLIAEREGK